MADVDSLIAAIYEAGALPERWTSVLEEVASSVTALGANLITTSSSGFAFISTPSVAEITREFDEQGWNQHNTRVSRLLERAAYPGFLTDLDLHTPEEIRTLPMYRHFLTPRQADAGAATLIAGASNDGILLALEAFRDHEAASEAVPLLNRLRPHLARAAALSSRIDEARAVSLLDALNAISTPLALLDKNGRVVSATDHFFETACGMLVDTPRRLCIADDIADARLVNELAAISESGSGASIALRNEKSAGVGVLQLIPARRGAQDLFSNVVAYALIAHSENTMLPSVDILASLFDLTPAEARVARFIAEGKSPAALASELGISRETVRSHLKKAFLKTSTQKQSELTALLSRLSS